jgi:glycine/D-amino acid oxidase-like deaminating enzyme
LQAGCKKLYMLERDGALPSLWRATTNKTSDEAGVNMKYTDVLPAPIPMRKAVAVDGQAKFHRTHYVLGMAQAFQILGGLIIEHCRVKGSHEATVHTDQSDLRCSHLIYATPIPSGISRLNTLCAPYGSYAMAVMLKEGYPDGLLYDLDEPYHYYRTHVIDGKPYLIAGGEDHKTGQVTNTQTCFLKLESRVCKHFKVDEVKYRWSSQYFEPTDGLPYTRHMPGKPGHRISLRVSVATGWCTEVYRPCFSGTCCCSLPVNMRRYSTRTG